MIDSIKSLIDCGTKLWLDSIDPALVDENKQMGATGATSNPIIIADLIQSGRYDAQLRALLAESLGINEAEVRVITLAVGVESFDHCIS